jgi:hypothetical protein
MLMYYLWTKECDDGNLGIEEEQAVEVYVGSAFNCYNLGYDTQSRAPEFVLEIHDSTFLIIMYKIG